MAPLRDIDPTGLYHVCSRGNYRAPIFLDEDHYETFLGLVGRVTRRRKWIVLDWCLMPNHHHLLVQLTEGGLSDGLRELHGCFSRWSNLQTGRTGTGHFVKNRPTLVDVVRDGHLWELMSYIPLNPVRAGLVAEPDEWRWSGFRATLGLEQPRRFHRPAELLRMFAKDRTVAVARYRDLVSDARVRDGHPTSSDQVREAPPLRRVVESPAWG